MLRLALTPRWLGYLAGAAVIAIAFLALGQWQWGRYETKQAHADRVEAHHDGAAVPVAEVLTTEPMALADEWRRVSATGTYDADRTVLARNRPHDGEYGSEVLVPLRLTSGETLVVDRGWVPNSEKGAQVRPDVPPPPTGEVSVTGWVRPGEPDLDRPMPPGLVASIDLPELADKTGGPVLGGYLDLQSEEPQVPRPTPLEAPDVGTGPHLAYAIQWWLGIPAILIYAWLALRREAESTSGETSRAPRPKKVRVWDEEDG